MAFEQRRRYRVQMQLLVLVLLLLLFLFLLTLDLDRSLTRQYLVLHFRAQAHDAQAYLRWICRPFRSRTVYQMHR